MAQVTVATRQAFGEVWNRHDVVALLTPQGPAALAGTLSR